MQETKRSITITLDFDDKQTQLHTAYAIVDFTGELHFDSIRIDREECWEDFAKARQTTVKEIMRENYRCIKIIIAA